MKYSIHTLGSRFSLSLSKLIILHCTLIIFVVVAVAALAPQSALAERSDTTLMRTEVKEQIVSKRQFGWEHPLTAKDPNLSHWHWEPINNSFRQVQTKKIYNHVARPLALKRDFQVREINSTNTNCVSAKISTKRPASADLSGKLERQSSCGKNAPVIYSYDSTYRSAQSLFSNRTSEHSRTQVAGKILRGHAWSIQ